MILLATCSFADFKPSLGRPVRISLGRPKWPLRYELPDVTFWPLTPRSDYFRAPPEEFDRRYLARLDRVGAERRREQFRVLDDGRPLILLCFERNVTSGADCHRRRFAEWWLLQTGEVIPEIGGTA
jgi:hypothetical protein